MKQTVIYETGNAWQVAGDIINICGSHLDAVDQIRICHIDDSIELFSPSYFPMVLHDKGEPNSVYFETTDLSTLSYKDVSVGMIHRAENVIQFEIPRDLKNGILALSFTGKEMQEIIRLINVPRIFFTMGDEGAISTAGSRLFVAGVNLCPKDAPQKVKLILRGKNAEYVLSPAHIDSEYAAEFALPETIPHGEYEVMIYNGYGDARCCSAPSTVTVDASPREAWPKAVFNVKEFGAWGRGAEHNDTVAIIRALRAAESNGGGVVYFPQGTYTLIHPISVPERVRLMGDGLKKSRIIWLPFNWDTFELPENLIALGSNVEISGLDFSGTRVGSIFVTDPQKPHENIYIHDCRIYLSPYAGAPTWGSVPVAYYADYLDLHRAVTLEKTTSHKPKADGVVFQLDHVTNLRMHDLELYVESSMFFITGDYVYMSDCEFSGEWSTVSGSCCILRNLHFDKTTLGAGSDHCYHAHCTHRNRTTNNRELMTTDMFAPYSGPHIAPISDTEYRLDYKIPDGQLVGTMMMVHDGSGAGQTRRIVAHEGNRIMINQPFVIAPDDESHCTIQQNRSHMICVDNDFYNGGAYQYYGSQVDSVIADNHFDKTLGISMWACLTYGINMPHWYITIANNHFSDANHLSGYGLHIENSVPYLRYYIGGNRHQCDNMAVGIVIRENELCDGYRIYLKVSQSDHYRFMSGFVVQKNTVRDAEHGMALELNPYQTDLIIRDNTMINVTQTYRICEAYQEALQKGTVSRNLIEGLTEC